MQAQSPVISTSDGYGASNGADIPPAGMESDGESESGPVFTGYRGKYGILKTNIASSYATVGLLLGGHTSPDGVLFLSYAEPIADSWIAWGKTNPQYMRIVNILWGGPFMTLILAHSPLIGGVMANHNISVGKFLNPLNASLFARQTANRLGGLNPAGSGMQPGAQPHQGTGSEVPPADPFMAAYQPVGPMAPTEDAGPPPSPDMTESLTVYPDEGVPAEIDVQLRQAAQQFGVPYGELRNQWLLERAQQRIGQNQHVVQPGALGMPITKPGA